MCLVSGSMEEGRQLGSGLRHALSLPPALLWGFCGASETFAQVLARQLKV